MRSEIASPKSPICATPSAVSHTFPGLRSRCTMLCACTKKSPRATPFAMSRPRVRTRRAILSCLRVQTRAVAVHIHTMRVGRSHRPMVRPFRWQHSSRVIRAESMIREGWSARQALEPGPLAARGVALMRRPRNCSGTASIRCARPPTSSRIQSSTRRFRSVPAGGVILGVRIGNAVDEFPALGVPHSRRGAWSDEARRPVRVWRAGSSRGRSLRQRANSATTRTPSGARPRYP